MATTYQLGYNSKVIKHRGISIVTFFNIFATCSSTGRAMILIIRYGFDSHQYRLKKETKYTDTIISLNKCCLEIEE